MSRRRHRRPSDLVGEGADVAIAFCDEPVRSGPPPSGTSSRFELACEIAAANGVHLVDWFACDDEAFRSFRLALHPDEPWWPGDAIVR